MKIITLFSTVLLIYGINASDKSAENKSAPRFELDYQWTFINFTWESEEAYDEAITSKRYIPENNAMAGIKFYKDRFYIAMPRICEGTPVTLGYISTDDSTPKLNPLIAPFPDWATNDLTEHTCDKLESVQSMEIDADGILWVIDGMRGSANPKCPPKIVLYDLNNGSNVVQSYTFPEEICLSKGGFLNDLVIDASDGTFAYITDTGGVDPGLIIYSRSQNRAWKIRDASMFSEIVASNFTVDDVLFPNLTPIDGIALSPLNPSGPRTVYYCALTALNLYSVGTEILKSEEISSNGQWRFNVMRVGQKQAQSDGLVMDNEGNLYYGLLPLYGVGRWNSREDFVQAEIVDENREMMIWTDSFSFDDKGYLYLLANNIHRYFTTSCATNMTIDGTKFRILKYYTGTKSYLYQ